MPEHGRFTPGQIKAIRYCRSHRRTIADMMHLFPRIERDALVEAIWATIRYAGDNEAAMHANYALSCQEVGIPLVNGKRPRVTRPAPMF